MHEFEKYGFVVNVTMVSVFLSNTLHWRKFPVKPDGMLHGARNMVD